MTKQLLAKALSCSLCCLFCLSVEAQNFAEILKQYPSEMAVFMDKTVDYSISLKDNQPYVESHETEKIIFLSQNASNYAGTFSFDHSYFRELINYSANTKTANNKIIKVANFKTASDKQSFVFYDDVKKMSFNYPSVEPGAIGTLDVSWINKDPHLLPSHYFKSYLPTLNSELKLVVSNDITIHYQKMGLDTANIMVTVDRGKRTTTYIFKYKDCIADKNYGDSPGYAWYSPHVVFSIANYKNSEGKIVPYLSNGDDLYRLNYSYIKTINSQVSPEVKRVADSLISKLTLPADKAKKIYNWVQQNIKYVAFEDGMGGFVPREAALVCTRRFGDCKDMSSILTQMMNYAGIEAYYTWIGTRTLPYKFSITPLPLVSNHMICTIKIDGRLIYLDGTDATCVFGVPSSHIQDKEAMIAINEKEFKIATVPAASASENLLVDTTWVEMAPTGLKGRIKQDLRGYFAAEAYSKLMYWPQKELKDRLKDEFIRGSNKFNLDSFTVDRKPAADHIAWDGSFTLPGYATKVGDEYYVNLNLFRFYENAKIDVAKRIAPIEFDFKFQKKYVTVLRLPKGYKVTSVPPNKSYQQGPMTFNLSYVLKGDQLILVQDFYNQSLILNSDQFEDWNKMLDQLLPAYKESLSLTKI